MAACLPSTYTVETELASVSQSYPACRDGTGLRLPVVPSARTRFLRPSASSPLVRLPGTVSLPPSACGAVSLAPCACADLCFFEAQEDAAQANFVVIVQGRGGFARQLLPIQERKIGAILILQHILAIIVEDARVQAGDAAFFAAVRGEVNIGIDIAHGILAANHDVILPAQIELLVIGLYDQTGREGGCRSGGGRGGRGC